MRRVLVAGLVLWAGASVAWADEVGDLVKVLKEGDADERRAAAKQLGEMGTEARPAAQALITAVKSDKDLFVRRFAAQALGEIGADPKTAIPALTALLKEENKEVKEAAVLSLGRLGSPAVAPLVNVLKDKPKAGKGKAKNAPQATDPSAYVRGKAAEALGNIGPGAKEAVPVLIEALQDANIRAEAAEALGKIGKAAKEAVPALQEAAKAKDAKKNKGFRDIVNAAIKKIQAKD